MIETARVAKLEEGGKRHRRLGRLAKAATCGYSYRVGHVWLDVSPARTGLFPYSFRMEDGGVGFIDVSA